MTTTNFGFLEEHDPLLLQLARSAEQAFVPDPNTTLYKVRQLGEAIAKATKKVTKKKAKSK
jgi:type I restriction enzyme, R subunit